jgi:hypothetical protein
MSPPGPNQEYRKTGQNSKAHRPQDKIEHLHVRRIAEDQQQEDAEEHDPGKRFL